MEHTVLYVGIAIETGGSSPKNHPLLAIGAVLAEPSQEKAAEILERASWYLKPFPGQAIEKECLDNFQHFDILERIERDAAEPMEALLSFSSWINNLTLRFPGRSIIFVAYNPLHAIGFIDTLLMAKNVRSDSIRYLSDGMERPIYDPAGIQMTTDEESYSIKVVSSDYWLEDKAEFAVQSYFRERDIAEQRDTDLEHFAYSAEKMAARQRELERNMLLLCASSILASGFILWAISRR